MVYSIFFIVSLTTIISFFYYKKFKGTIYRYFLYFLLIPFFTEFIYNIVLYWYYNYDIILFNPHIFYNFYLVTSFIFYFLFYKSISKNKRNKIIFSVLNYIFIGFIIFDIIILKNSIFKGFRTPIIVFGGILLLITLILFLIEIINSNKIIFNISKSFIFWISTGLLLFYVGIIPIMISREFLNYNETYAVILVVLNAIMYGSFVIGMIKSDTKYNY